MARPRSGLRLRADVVEERRNKLGLVQKDLGVSDRTYRHWIAGGAITLEMAKRLAMRLGLGIEDIATGLPHDCIAEAADSEDELSRRARHLRDLAVGGALIAQSGRLRRYIKRIGLSFVPLRGFAFYFEHKAIDRHYYAAVTITPATQEGDRSTFVFAYELGPLRIDYGAVEVAGEYARLKTFFAATSEPIVDLSAGGSFTVWTWFGKERCRFQVRSRLEFTATLDLDPLRVDAGKRSPGVLCFHAAPHHLEER